jgi:hypothetical protein
MWLPKELCSIVGIEHAGVRFARSRQQQARRGRLEAAGDLGFDFDEECSDDELVEFPGFAIGSSEAPLLLPRSLDL